jgi:hypothetical protein
MVKGGIARNVAKFIRVRRVSVFGLVRWVSRMTAIVVLPRSRGLAGEIATISELERRDILYGATERFVFRTETPSGGLVHQVV